MNNMKVLCFLFLLQQSVCQNYTQTRDLLDGDLVLHYKVDDQKFQFKLVGKAEHQIGLAFSYDVSSKLVITTLLVRLLTFQDYPRDGFISVVRRDDQPDVVDLRLAASAGLGMINIGLVNHHFQTRKI